MDIDVRQVKEFEQQLRAVIRAMKANILQLAANGQLFSPDADIRIASAPDIYAGLVSALQESGYYDAVRDLIEKDRDLIKSVAAQRTAAGLPTKFSKQSAETLAALQNIEYLRFESVGSTVISSIQQELMNYVIRGTTEQDFILGIENALDNKLAKYSSVYAQTSRSMFIQQAHDQAAKEYDGELYWEYFGPEDDRVRDACQEGLNIRYFTDAERQDFEAATADEREWNCRHIFLQITKETYEEETGGTK